MNAKLKSKSEQIIMIVSGTSRMFQVGKIQFEDATASSNIITNSLNSWLGTVNSWLVGKNDEGVRSCLFEPLPLVHDRVDLFILIERVDEVRDLFEPFTNVEKLEASTVIVLTLLGHHHLLR